MKGWSDRLEIESLDAVTGVVELVERVYTRHNTDDLPDGQLCPSMSVGDVVVIGEVAASVDAVGFARVQVDRADLITDRSW